MLNGDKILLERIRAHMAVNEFLADCPSIFEIQTYIQMARNDLKINEHDEFAKEVIKILSDDN